MEYISEAVHDEQGRLGWEGLSIAGDQTGSEVLTRERRSSETWTKIYRPKLSVDADIIGESALQCAANDHIGYDQSRRLELYNAWKELPDTNKNIMSIDKDVNCDCSAMAAMCCINAGMNITPEMRTNIEDYVLMGSGKFDRIDYTDKTELKKGDVLWRQGHTGVVSIIDGTTHYTVMFIGAVTKLSGVYRLPRKKIKYHVKAHPFVGKGNLVEALYKRGKFYFCRVGTSYGYILKERITKV